VAVFRLHSKREEDRMGEKEQDHGVEPLQTGDDPDVEAQGLREVMSVGLAAAAFVGVPSAAKAADSPGTGDQTVLIESSKLDLDRDGYVGLDELERAGYKAHLDLLRADGYDVTFDGLEAAGYEIPGARLEAFLDGGEVMLKRGIDSGLDVLVDYGVAAWPNKLSEIDTDGDGYLSFGELERAGYKVSLELLHADGYDVTLDSLEAAGMKIPGGELTRFLADHETVALKRNVDTGLDVLLEYGVAEWPNKLSKIDADADGDLSFAELKAAGYRVSLEPLQAQGYDVTLSDLETAGYKVSAVFLHELMSDLDTVSLKEHVDPALDTVLQKWRGD
jgi:EF hand